ncbi:calphotin-like [Leguminivora glycinivorella]|uniref:calphotin-like n=1 Tax=Leguminivora glycinivorella TaxID=1035111 RepID=UPI00200CE56F|nr:calphotin-like [Leguminivora glycinivorella]
MISKTIFLFVFGATIASAQFMPRLIRPTTYDMSLMPYLRSTGCPSSPALAPVICQFMQPNLGLVKPQLIKPTTYIPPLVVEKCDEPQLEIELPPYKPIVIPEAPILPPITLPKFPVPVIPEPLPPMPIVEPCEPAPVAVSSAISVPVGPMLPPLAMPALPEIIEYRGADISETVINGVGYEGMLVPEAPTVVIPEAMPGSVVKPLSNSALAVPALTEIIEYHGADISETVIDTDGLDYQAMLVPEAPTVLIPEAIPGTVIKPLSIPPAPVLPPAPLPEIPIREPVPEIPVRVEIPAPIRPPMLIEEPCITDVIVPERVPMPIAHMPVPHPVPMPIVPMPFPRPVPMPIVPVREPVVAEPCEPAIAPVVKLPARPVLMPAFPAPATGPVLFPARNMFVNRNVVVSSLPYNPYMRRI